MGMMGKLEIRIRGARLTPFTPLLHGINATPGVSGTSGPVLMAVGATVPADGGIGFGKGAAFFQMDPVTAAVLGIYSNAGTVTACNFDLTSA